MRLFLRVNEVMACGAESNINHVNDKLFRKQNQQRLIDYAPNESK
jgi:hypothetical protein